MQRSISLRENRVKAKLAMLLLGFATASAAAERQLYTSWSDYGGAADSMQYSALKILFNVAFEAL